MSNLVITENSTQSLTMFNPKFRAFTLTATAAITLPAGTVLGRITANDKLIQYASGASDGSETPVAVLPEEAVFTAAGDRGVNAIIGGELIESLVSVYNGGTPAAPSESEVETLRGFGILLVKSTQQTEQDNS